MHVRIADAAPFAGDYEMSDIHQEKESPKADHAERNILLTLALVVTLEVFVLVWLFF